MHGISAYFAWLNRGKRSVALDLKTERAREALARLIARADVFVHNLAPGAVERLGFGYDALAERHPRLIWCGISGYGPDGPYRDRKAYDLLVQGEAGVVNLTGSPEAPARVGVSIADATAGLYAYSSVLAALLHRERTGKGERIDISMLECLTEWMTPPLYVWQGTGKILPRTGARHNMVVPFGAYACADGAVNFGVQNEREWKRFCEEVMEMPELAEDERFAGNGARVRNRAMLEAIVEGFFRDFTCAEMRERLDAAQIANGAVNDVAAVATHPQLAARGRWATVDSPVGPIPALVPPHNLRGVTPRMDRVPGLGEHTREVLAEIGMEGDGDE
jgi:crotonobetainyl-CoA:carnitine CoA-transferase CaiB-like acyl-CoA transferase